MANIPQEDKELDAHIRGWEDIMAEPPDVDWLIPGIFPVKSRALMYADSGVGKSTTATSIACHVATGKPFHGHEVKQGSVYYIASENPEAFPATAKAWDKQHKGRDYWEKHHKRPDDAAPPLHLVDTPVDLSDPDSVTALLKKLGPARLIVIDTLLTSMGDGDILNPSDNYRIIRQINRIMRHTGATVLVVHHKPDSGKHPLGGSALRGGFQVRIELSRQRNKKLLGEKASFEDGDTITLTNEKLTRSTNFPPIILPVRLVHLKRGIVVPVIASEKVKKQPRTRQPRSDATPATPPARNASQKMDFNAACAMYGEDRAKIAEVTGISPVAVRQRFSRMKRATRHAA